MRSLAIGLVLTIGVLAGGCSSQPPGEGNYLSQVEAARTAKDRGFLSAADSPVPPDKRAVFVPLAYFPIDSAYAVPAAFEEAPPADRPRMEMETSSHKPRTMERVGVLKFRLQGKPLQLAAFTEAGDPPDRLFVPFADLTSGSETYGGGRYLEIARSSTGVYVVDFNRAFNPYCYYNPTYECPYPPKENRLPVAIRAGERLKAGAH